jgi:hypothetical protein
LIQHVGWNIKRIFLKADRLKCTLDFVTSESITWKMIICFILWLWLCLVVIDASPVATSDTREVRDLQSACAAMDIWGWSEVAIALCGAACIKSRGTHVITKRNWDADRCVFVANASVLARFGRIESSTGRQTHPLTYLLERVWESLIGANVYSAVTAFERIQIILFTRSWTHPEFVHAFGSYWLLHPSATHGHAGERVYQCQCVGAGIYRSAFLCVSSLKRSQALVDLIHMLFEWSTQRLLVFTEMRLKWSFSWLLSLGHTDFVDKGFNVNVSWLT